MRPDKLFIGNVDSGGCHRAGHHLFLPLEEILVVRTTRGAVGDDDSGLPTAACTAGTLGIVGRRGGHVPQIDGVQVGNIDAQLHCGRAEHDRELTGTEFFFTLLANQRRHLCSVFAALHSGHVGGGRSIEVNKVLVGPEPDCWGSWYPQWAVESLRAVTRNPTQCAGIELVGRTVVVAYLNEIRACEHLADILDDSLCIFERKPRGKAGGPPQKLSNSPSSTQENVGGAVIILLGVAVLGTRIRQLARKRFFIEIDPPSLGEPLTALSLDRFLPLLVEAIHPNGEFPSQVVEERASNVQPLLSSGLHQRLVGALPVGVVVADILERFKLYVE